MLKDIPYKKAEKAIRTVCKSEENIPLTTQGKLLIGEGNILISNHLLTIFDKLGRVLSMHGKDIELKKTYTDIIDYVRSIDWSSSYYEKAKVFHEYLSKLDNYIEYKYKIKSEVNQKIDTFKKELYSIAKSSVTKIYREQNIQGINFITISKQIQKETKYTYLEISHILSTSGALEVIAYALETSISTIEGYFNAGKKVEIVSKLLKFNKLGFVISTVLEHKDLGKEFNLT